VIDGIDGVDAPDRTAALCDLFEILFQSNLFSSLPFPTFCPALALAYVNLDGIDGYSSADDVLIAGLFDTDRDGVPSVGDRVVYGTYPTSFGTPPSTAEFGLSQVGVVTSVLIDTSNRTFVQSGSSRYQWEHSTEREHFSEFFGTRAGVEIHIIDWLLLDINGSASDHIEVAPSSAGLPTGFTGTITEGPRPSDNVHIDVDIL
jgi:hypothetical protein